MTDAGTPWSRARASLGRGLGRGLAELGDALFPPLCWLCRTSAAVDGLGCEEHALAPCALDPAEPRCEGCAERLPVGIARGPCARCRREPRGYRRLVAFGAYREGSALREWILAYKHGGRRELATPLAALLARALASAGWAGEHPAAHAAAIVPVPLHPLRRLERGYDQAALLAGELAVSLGLVHARALRRARWTAPQGAPGARSRAANVGGAFEPLARGAQRVAGRAAWLVDDVVASGATVRACAEALRRAGAAEVSVVCLARAERGRDDDLALPLETGPGEPHATPRDGTRGWAPKSGP